MSLCVFYRNPKPTKMWYWHALYTVSHHSTVYNVVQQCFSAGFKWVAAGSQILISVIFIWPQPEQLQFYNYRYYFSRLLTNILRLEFLLLPFLSQLRRLMIWAAEGWRNRTCILGSIPTPLRTGEVDSCYKIISLEYGCHMNPCIILNTLVPKRAVLDLRIR
jgi:hypothetical protein